MNGGSGTVTLTITAGSTASIRWWRQPFPPTAGNRNVLYLLAGLMLAFSAWFATRQRKLRMIGVAFTLLLAVGLTSCGGGSSSTTTTTTTTVTTTPAETGTVTITGTSGALSNSTSIALSVQ